MFPPVATRDPAAVEMEVQAAYLATFPNADVQFMPRIFGWSLECFSGHYADYQAVDTRYHDFEHTLQGTLCVARLLQGRHSAGAQPQLTQRLFQLGIIAILFHDTGYLKRRGDPEGTGAKYTITHVARSAEFAAKFLAENGFNPTDIRTVQNVIQCTGLDALLSLISFQSEMEKTLGHILGTADLLGQMAAEDYVDKLPSLYAEIEEAKRHAGDTKHFVATFSSAADLMRKTPMFWEKYVQLKLNRDFGGVYQFLNDPYPFGPNVYLERIEANMERLRSRIGAAKA